MKKCDYCGEENADEAAECRRCSWRFPVAQEIDAVPELPPFQLIKPDELTAAFSFEEGFHRCDWNLMRRWIDGNLLAAEREEGWNEAALMWVSKLRDDLGGDYFNLISRESVLLCDLKLETARWVQDYAGRTVTAIKEHLGDTAWAGTFGRDVILIFSDEDDYYQYLVYHSRDGEQASSGGVCIASGYTHIALPWRDELDVANAIIHELTHGALAHLSLPLWLNEGVAVILDRAVGPRLRGPVMRDELAERHFAFWNPVNLQSFWAGTSFYEPGDPNELSYSLAEVFVKLIIERVDRGAFQAFLNSAHWGDAGQTAALDILGIDLGEIAGTFLGEGEWRPIRKAMVECWEKAHRLRPAEESVGETASDSASAETPSDGGKVTSSETGEPR